MSLQAHTAVLPAVARVVSEAPTLRDTVSRLASTLAAAIPFERLQLLRLDRTESIVLYVASAAGETEVTVHKLSADAGEPGVDPAAQSRMICPPARRYFEKALEGCRPTARACGRRTGAKRWREASMDR